jgi:hypothetical protein
MAKTKNSMKVTSKRRFDRGFYNLVYGVVSGGKLACASWRNPGGYMPVWTGTLQLLPRRGLHQKVTDAGKGYN